MKKDLAKAALRECFYFITFDDEINRNKKT